MVIGPRIEKAEFTMWLVVVRYFLIGFAWFIRKSKREDFKMVDRIKEIERDILNILRIHGVANVGSSLTEFEAEEIAATNDLRFRQDKIAGYTTFFE